MKKLAAVLALALFPSVAMAASDVQLPARGNAISFRDGFWETVYFPVQPWACDEATDGYCVSYKTIWQVTHTRPVQQ